MSKQILAALLQLDVNNSNHWTADGAPRLDTVKFLAGDQTITRDQLNSVAPGFSRAQPTLPGTQEGATQAPAGPATAPQAASQGDTSQTAGAAPTQATQEPKPNPEGDDDGSEEGGEIAAGADPITQDRPAEQDELAAAQAALQKALAAKAEADKGVAAASKEVDRIIEAREKSGLKPTFADTFQGYLKQQQREREQRAARIEAMRGVPLKDILPTKAKIDEAFRRRTGRDGKRPTRL